MIINPATRSIGEESFRPSTTESTRTNATTANRYRQAVQGHRRGYDRRRLRTTYSPQHRLQNPLGFPPHLLKSLIFKLPGHSEDLTAVTFQIHDEDHTLGNALRYIIMKKFVNLYLAGVNDSPDVEFCGYSIPHPSEPKLNLRIQTYGMVIWGRWKTDK